MRIPDDGWDLSTVSLEKSSARQGFGIAISGGKDNPHFRTGDISIFVTDIVKGSPADGTLKIGDKLISVNGKTVDGGTHQDAVKALKAAGMSARVEVKRPGVQKKPSPVILNSDSQMDTEPVNVSTPLGSVKSDSDRGRSRKKPKEMEQESGERTRSSRSRSRNREGDENGEKPRRHRSKSREAGEDGEKRRRRSKSREAGEGEDKPRRSRSRTREAGEGEDKPRRSRSKTREAEEGEDKPRRSRSRTREAGEDGEKRRSRSKTRDKTEDSEKSSGEKSAGEEGEKQRSRSKTREGADGEKRHRSRSKAREGEDGEKRHRSKSRTRGEGEEGEKRSRSRSRTRGEGEEGEKRHRSRSRTREEGGDGEKRRSRSRGRDPEVKGKEGSDLDLPKPVRNRGRSKSRSRDDLTRSRSKESLHRSKSKSREQVSGLPPNSEMATVVLERGPQGYGFSLAQQIYIRDMANDSPAAKAENLEKGDIVHEINGTRVDSLKVSECIEIIRAATEQLTLTIVKKSKDAKPSEPHVEKKKTKSRPADAPDSESEHKAKPSPPVEIEVTEEAVEKLEEVAVEASVEPPEEPLRESTPPPDISAEKSLPSSEDLNETADSWAQASPEKQAKPEPTQEMENMDAKLERLDTGRKLEARMSQLPNARVISFHKTGSVGIQVAGGNSLGIFVAAVRDDSPAAKEGLEPGDQILMCNEMDFEQITREEAVLILLALPDDVSLVVEKRIEALEQIKTELGDNFFIRVNFDHLERTTSNEFLFRKGEIFNVRDTMYHGLIGYWQAQRVGKNGAMLERGVLPNKSRAEQLALAQKMEDKQALMPGRSKVKRRPSAASNLKKHKFVSQDRLDESSFESVPIPAYERVLLKIADFMRPVVVLGALGDLVRMMLVEEMPDRFDVPTPMDFGGGVVNDASYGNSIKISEIRNVIAKNKHCVLDITPEGIEMLMYAQLCPIVILLKSTSRGAVKEMRGSLVSELKSLNHITDGDPLTTKQVKKVFSNAKKLEEFYPHIFTAKINTHIAGGDVLSREFYHKLKEIIFAQQAQSAWMPEERPREMIEDMVIHPPNYTSYLSGADSDTEGESMTSSPVLAKKHFEDEDESRLQSPADDAVFDATPKAEVEPKRHRERSRDRRHHRDRERDRDESSDRERRKHRKSKGERKSRNDAPDSPPSYKPEDPPIRQSMPDSPKIDHNGEAASKKHPEPSIGELEELIVANEMDTVESSAPLQNDEPIANGYSDDSIDHPPSPHTYRDPPPISQHIISDEIEKAVHEFMKDTPEEKSVYGHGPKESTVEDLPVLRDPNYSLPRPVPDSPPSRRPPEAKTKPYQNAIKVLPNELNNDSSLDEKRKSLKPIPDNNEDPLMAFAAGAGFSNMNGLEKMARSPSPKSDEDVDLPPYRPPPPPSKEEVPTKILTLKERMSILQSKINASAPAPAPKPQPPVEEEPPPPARPVAPRNYIKDMRNRGGPSQDLYARSITIPSPEFPEVTRIAKPVDSPYINVSASQPLESNPYSGYDYVKPYTNDYPHSKRLDTIEMNGHYSNPSSLRADGYSVPVPSRDYHERNAYDDEYYPPYRTPDKGFNSKDDLSGTSDGDDDDEPRVIATARDLFDHRGGLLESIETNVSIYIPYGALPEGKKQEVYFKVCQDSKNMPPLDSNSGETLLSPLVMCGPHGLQFRKPIELRLPHRGATCDSMAFSLKSSDSPVGHPGDWKNVKLGGNDLDRGRAYQVTDDTVSVLVDHF